MLLQDSCMKILSRQLVAMMRSKIFLWWVGYSNLLFKLFYPTPHLLLSFFHLSLLNLSTMIMTIPTSQWDSNWGLEIGSWHIKSLTLYLDLVKKDMFKHHHIGLVTPFIMTSCLLKLLPFRPVTPNPLTQSLRLFGIFIDSSPTPSMQEQCQMRYFPLMIFLFSIVLSKMKRLLLGDFFNGEFGSLVIVLLGLFALEELLLSLLNFLEFIFFQTHISWWIIYKELQAIHLFEQKMSLEAWPWWS